LRHGLLRGRDHSEIGAVAAEAEGALAVALSRGGARKTYAHHDPNEDAALFASGPGGIVLAVADAHEGEVAAATVLEHLLGNLAGRWTATRPLGADAWEGDVLAGFLELNEVVGRAAAQADTPGSCTTLTLAVVRPAQDLLLYASIGDSHLFQASGTSAIDHGVRSSSEARRKLGSYFLGWGSETEASLADKCRIGTHSLASTRAIVLATDGISERNIGHADPCAAVAESVLEVSGIPAELQSLQLARTVVEGALEAHVRHGAGDNVAVASFWSDSLA
jgi:serine/threonine protein phosphatase PrpC